MLSKSDLDHCANPEKGVECKNNWDYEDCGEVEGAKWKNFGCKHKLSESFDHFTCANRMDKKNKMFLEPPVAVKKIWGSRNYNQVLNYNKTHISCGTRNFTYKELKSVREKHGSENCTLKIGTVPIWELWRDLQLDFSFEYHSKINES